MIDWFFLIAGIRVCFHKPFCRSEVKGTIKEYKEIGKVKAHSDCYCSSGIVTHCFVGSMLVKSQILSLSKDLEM